MGTKNRRQSRKSSQWKVTLSRLGSRQQWEIFHKSSALSPGPAEERGGQGRARLETATWKWVPEPDRASGGPVEGTLDSE